MERRIYKSTRNKVIAGVCGGIAEYFNINPLIVRLIFLFSSGGSIIIYLILAVYLTDDENIQML